jgi:hypothetical protein
MGKWAFPNYYYYYFIYLIIVCFSSLMRARPEASYRCPTLTSSSERVRKWVDHSLLPGSKLKIDPKVLLFVETTFSKLGRDLAELLVHNRMK